MSYKIVANVLHNLFDVREFLTQRKHPFVLCHTIASTPAEGDSCYTPRANISTRIQSSDLLATTHQQLSGGISNVDGDLSVDKVTNLIRTEMKVLSVRRVGESHTIYVVFAGNAVPIHLKVRYMCYLVWAYDTTPLECQKCYIGHVSASSTKGQRRRKCAAPHDAHECTSLNHKCINCGKAHDSISLISSII